MSGLKVWIGKLIWVCSDAFQTEEERMEEHGAAKVIVHRLAFFILWHFSHFGAVCLAFCYVRTIYVKDCMLNCACKML